MCRLSLDGGRTWNSYVFPVDVSDSLADLFLNNVDEMWMCYGDKNNIAHQLKPVKDKFVEFWRYQVKNHNPREFYLVGAGRTMAKEFLCKRWLAIVYYIGVPDSDLAYRAQKEANYDPNSDQLYKELEKEQSK